MKEPKPLTDLRIAEMSIAYRHSSNRLLLLDYDGTLVDFKNDPEGVIPNKEVLDIIKQLASDQNNTVALVTGRSQKYISQWFEEMNVFILAEHGSMIKEPGNHWVYAAGKENEWKNKIKRLMEFFTTKVSGSFLEEKSHSIVWHYRNTDPKIGYIGSDKLLKLLNRIITPDMDVKIVQGKKMIEVKKKGFDKGIASQNMLQMKQFSFIMAIGDDKTDEEMFSRLPPYSYSFKVGYGLSNAKMFIEGPKEVINLLKILVHN